MLRIRPVHLPRLAAFAVALLALPFPGCGNGGNGSNLVVTPMIKARVDQVACVPSQPQVVFANANTAGDVVNVDIDLQSLSGTVDVDDADLVLRYDASFMQVTDIRPETLFGNCGAINTACNLLSPTCLNNQSAANGGGTRFCRSNGTTFCQTDADCPSLGDACGSFGQLELSFAVITGPRTCSNKTGQSCLSAADCRFCKSNSSVTCTDECSGVCIGSVCSGGSQDGRICGSTTDCADTCGSSQQCVKGDHRACTDECRGSCVGSVCVGGSFNGAPCSSGIECLDSCSSGACSGCPSVQVSGTRKIVNISLRVIATGSSSLQFVTSVNPMATASKLRKDALDLPADFCPSPTSTTGSFTVTGTK